MQSRPVLLDVVDARAGAALVELAQTPVLIGERVLLWGAPAPAGTRSVADFDPYVLARIVAFHDALVGKPPAHEWGGSGPVAVVLPPGTTVDEWAIQALGAGDERLSQLMAHITRSECYQVVRYVLRRRSDMSIAEMAAEYGLSTAQFYRHCKQFFGQTLKRQLRVMRAASALLDGVGRQSSLTAVAMDNGYASASHFTFDVRSLLGRPPGQAYNGIISTLDHEKTLLSRAAGSR